MLAYTASLSAGRQQKRRPARHAGIGTAAQATVDWAPEAPHGGAPATAHARSLLVQNWMTAIRLGLFDLADREPA